MTNRPNVSIWFKFHTGTFVAELKYRMKTKKSAFDRYNSYSHSLVRSALFFIIKSTTFILIFSNVAFSHHNSLHSKRTNLKQNHNVDRINQKLENQFMKVCLDCCHYDHHPSQDQSSSNELKYNNSVHLELRHNGQMRSIDTRQKVSSKSY